MRARIVRSFELPYTYGGDDGQDRGPHIRAASGIAAYRGRYVIVQDDTAFLGIAVGGVVDAIALPRGPDRRRRFEARLGNKHEKLDLESCCVIGDALFAFGSGSSEKRETIIRLDDRGATPLPSPALYAAIRAAVGGAINLEGAAVVDGELWLFHRGNTSAADRPAVVRVPTDLAPRVLGVERFDLGAIDGIRYGFTDATPLDDGRVLFLAAAEASPNAIDDGTVLGTLLGIIEGGEVRSTPLAFEGKPIKAEGITLDPKNPARAYVVDDPDDPDRATRLYELALDGF